LGVFDATDCCAHDPIFCSIKICSKTDDYKIFSVRCRVGSNKLARLLLLYSVNASAEEQRTTMTKLTLHSRNDDLPKRSAFDRLTKFIRVRSKPDSRFVEFDFAIGDPSLFVELVMPKGAFDAFCAANEVVHMTEEQIRAVDAEMEKWRYGEDTLMSHNHDHRDD
jgi:phenol hydroxylase P0 protein